MRQKKTKKFWKKHVTYFVDYHDMRMHPVFTAAKKRRKEASTQTMIKYIIHNKLTLWFEVIILMRGVKIFLTDIHATTLLRLYSKHSTFCEK